MNARTTSCATDIIHTRDIMSTSSGVFSKMHVIACTTILLLVVVGASVRVQAQCLPDTVFANTTTNSVCIGVQGAIRYVYTNALPNHETGTFPNAGNPNAIRAQRITLTMCAQPRMADTKTWLDKGSGSCPFWVFGVGVNGLEFDPIANEFFRNTQTGQLNREWNLNALSEKVNLGLDLNDAHVQPNGKYHYHGDPVKFIEKLGITSSAHSPIVAYAADGYPVYYRYVYASATDATSAIIDLPSCYQLKSGTRPGDGVSAPNGAYDGQYTQDYEFAPTVDCILDECNGRYGVTPEFPNGTYYYVITVNYPVIPRCFSGVPDKAFTIGPPPQGCSTSNAAQICAISDVLEDADELFDRIDVSPNPASTQLNILVADDHMLEHLGDVSIISTSGAVVLRTSGSPILDVSALPSGVYYARVEVGEAVITKRFVIAR